MKRNSVLMALALAGGTVFAGGPADKFDPVAANYVDWRGVTAKNYLCGREILPSELRHRVTVLIEIEPTDKILSQLMLAYAIVSRNPLANNFGTEGVDWETATLPRDLMPVLSVCNLRKRDELMEQLKARSKDLQESRCLTAMRGPGCSIYADVTFVGKPDSAGKLPYVCVMGPDPGLEPLYHGELTAANMKSIQTAIAKGRRQIAAWSAEASGKQAWKPFFGNVPEPKFHTSLVKAMEKAKNPKLKKCPLEPIMKGLLADVKSTDEAKATEAQVLYDALVQTREDLKLVIGFEAAGAWPFRAICDIQRLKRFWPSEPKSSLAQAEAAIKQIQGADKMGKIYARLQELRDPEFVVKSKSESKKIVAELNKYKKQIESMKSSDVIRVQNAALLLDLKIDDALMLVQSKVAE